jgi:anti-sigma-K factor RskA
MTELQAADVPSPNVWKRIENLVKAQPAAAAAPVADTGLLDALRRALGLWRGAALAGGLATVAAVVVGVNLNSEVKTRDGQLAQLTQQKDQLAAELRATPQVQYVAVLADDKSAASMVVTFDPKNQRLVLKRVGGFQEAADKSLQLWALPPRAGRSRWACWAASQWCV